MLDTAIGIQISAKPLHGLVPPVSRRNEERLFGEWLDAAPIRRLAAKEHLFIEGDPKTQVYYVEAGTVLIYKILPDAKRQIIEIAFPGDLIGLGASRAHAFNAQTTEPARVRCISVGVMNQMAAADPAVGLYLFKMLGRQLDAAHNHLLTTTYRTATSRVANFLIALSQRAGSGGHDSLQLVVPMRRADMADFLGLTIETVSRTLSKLKADGIIDLDHGGYVEIRDRSALLELAEGVAGHG